MNMLGIGLLDERGGGTGGRQGGAGKPMIPNSRMGTTIYRHVNVFLLLWDQWKQAENHRSNTTAQGRGGRGHLKKYIYGRGHAALFGLGLNL